MAKVLKEISLEHESLKSNTREMDEIVNLILHKIHAGNLGEARLDLNRVAEGISERFSEKESETRQLREKYATAAFFYEFFMSGRLSMKVIDSDVNFAKESPSYGSSDLTAVRMHDDVYISGVISAAHEIRKYAVRRAALKDIVSIGICRDVVKDLLGKFFSLLVVGFPTRTPSHGRDSLCLTKILSPTIATACEQKTPPHTSGARQNYGLTIHHL